MATAPPRALLEALAQGRLIPFVGAGVSIAVRRAGGGRSFPDWPALLEKAAERLECENRQQGSVVRALLKQSPPDLLRAAEYAKEGLASLWPGFLREVFDVSRKDVDDASLELARAVWAVGSKLVITTNYDRVLRWACPEGERDDLQEWRVSAPAAVLEALRGSLDRATIWHLHGSITEPTQVIVSPDGYARLYPADNEDRAEQKHKDALQALRQLMTSNHLLFVGFSLSDEKFMKQLEWVNDTFEGCGGPHYVLARACDVSGMRARVGKTGIQFIEVDEFEHMATWLRETANSVQGPDISPGGPTRNAPTDDPTRSPSLDIRHQDDLIRSFGLDVRHQIARWSLRWNDDVAAKLFCAVQAMRDHDTVRFFEERLQKAFPGKRGLVHIEDPLEAIGRLKVLLRYPLIFIQPDGGECEPIWEMVEGSMAIERFSASEDIPGLIHINHSRYRVRDVYAYRGRSFARSFLVLRWYPDEPTGLYPEPTTSELQMLTEQGLQYTEEYGIWEDQLVTREEYDDGHVYRNGESVQISARLEVRHLECGASVIAAKFSAVHGQGFDEDRERILRTLANDGSAFEELVKRVESLRRIDSP